jgi:hypothetical protein
VAADHTANPADAPDPTGAAHTADAPDPTGTADTSRTADAATGTAVRFVGAVGVLQRPSRAGTLALCPR